MHLASDYIHPTPRSGRCRIRIYRPEEEQDAHVVICSELPNNGGTSVTYAAEQLAAEVIRSHRLPTQLVWIEHWPKEATDGGEGTDTEALAECLRTSGVEIERRLEGMGAQGEG